MDSFLVNDGLRKVQSKDKIDNLKKNLKSHHDENGKSHNLLTFFKSMDIKKDGDVVEVRGIVNKNNLFESKENNKNLKVGSIGKANENLIKSVSDDYNKTNKYVKRENSLSTNKAWINKFLLGN